jgi:hypothetical protein
MEHQTGGKFLIAGSIIAGLAFIVPGVYGVQYQPPSNSKLSSVDLSTLPGFKGIIQVDNGLAGPVSFHDTLIAIVALFVLGLMSLIVDFGGASDYQKALKRVHRYGTVLSGIVAIPLFIWQFKYGGTPGAIRQRFITDLGGGPGAVEASHYVTGELGLAALIMFLGVLIALIGIAPKTSTAVLVLAIIAFIAQGFIIHPKQATGAQGGAAGSGITVMAEETGLLSGAEVSGWAPGAFRGSTFTGM